MSVAYRLRLVEHAIPRQERGNPPFLRKHLTADIVNAHGVTIRSVRIEDHEFYYREVPLESPKIKDALRELGITSTEIGMED